MITWGAQLSTRGPHALTGAKCAGTVPPPQDFHFNHWLTPRSMTLDDQVAAVILDRMSQNRSIFPVKFIRRYVKWVDDH